MSRKEATWTRHLWTGAFAGMVLVGALILRVWNGEPAATAQSARSQRAVPGKRAETGNRSAQIARQAQLQNPVVAIVNGEKITREHLARECIRRFGEEVLESEVNKRLILEECKKQQIAISQGEVEEEIVRMAAKFGLPKAKWLEMLEDERDISADQYRRDIVWPTLALRRIAQGNLDVNQEELAKAFESEFGPKVQVRMIATQSQAKAQKWHKYLKANPEHFGQLAKDQSEDEASASARGLIPPVRRHVGDPKVEQAVFALQEGQMTPVLQVAGQHVIFRCERRVPAEEIAPEQKKQILAEIEDGIADRKLRSAGTRVFTKLQAEASVENVFNNQALREQMPGVAARINGKPISMQRLGDQCILRHGRKVLEAEVNRVLLKQALKKRSINISEQDIQAEVARAAESMGYVTEDGSPNVNGWLERVRERSKGTVDLYVRDAIWPTVAMKKLVGSTIEITDEDLQKSFAANYGERVEVLAIVVGNQRTAHEVFDLARRNNNEKFFGELAHQYSIEPVSKANYGQVPPVRRFGGQPTLEEEAFRLQPGEISGLIAAGDKYIILRCLGRTNPVVKDMDVVRAELESDIREKKVQVAMNREFDRLKEGARIENYLEDKVRLASHEAPAAPSSSARKRR
ncbi:MAG: peptidylprolyl isomerase [Planctomycetota bacterium]